VKDCGLQTAPIYLLSHIKCSANCMYAPAFCPRTPYFLRSPGQVPYPYTILTVVPTGRCSSYRCHCL